MIVGGYTLDLYCRNGRVSEGKGCKHPGERGMEAAVGQFTGQTEREARKAARAAGWRFSIDDVTCPYCMRAKTSVNAEEKSDG